MSGAEEKQKGLYGYLVEFKDVDSIINAARKVRDEGYRNWDCHTPFPVHGLDGAMGIRMTKEAINCNLDCPGLESALNMEDRNQIMMTYTLRMK